jgi:hypothetical protein
LLMYLRKHWSIVGLMTMFDFLGAKVDKASMFDFLGAEYVRRRYALGICLFRHVFGGLNADRCK